MDTFRQIDLVLIFFFLSSSYICIFMLLHTFFIFIINHLSYFGFGFVVFMHRQSYSANELHSHLAPYLAFISLVFSKSLNRNYDFMISIFRFCSIQNQKLFFSVIDLIFNRNIKCGIRFMMIVLTNRWTRRFGRFLYLLLLQWCCEYIPYILCSRTSIFNFTRFIKGMIRC